MMPVTVHPSCLPSYPSPCYFPLTYQTLLELQRNQHQLHSAAAHQPHIWNGCVWFRHEDGRLDELLCVYLLLQNT